MNLNAEIRLPVSIERKLARLALEGLRLEDTGTLLAQARHASASPYAH